MFRNWSCWLVDGSHKFWRTLKTYLGWGALVAHMVEFTPEALVQFQPVALDCMSPPFSLSPFSCQSSAHLSKKDTKHLCGNMRALYEDSDLRALYADWVVFCHAAVTPYVAKMSLEFTIGTLYVHLLPCLICKVCSCYETFWPLTNCITMQKKAWVCSWLRGYSSRLQLSRGECHWCPLIHV